MQKPLPKPDPVKKESVKLIRHHNHGGTDKKPGDVIDVLPRQKAWLANQGIIETQTTTAGE